MQPSIRRSSFSSSAGGEGKRILFLPESVYVALINTAYQERLHVHGDVKECLVQLSKLLDLNVRILLNTYVIPIFGLMTKT